MIKNDYEQEITYYVPKNYDAQTMVSEIGEFGDAIEETDEYSRQKDENRPIKVIITIGIREVEERRNLEINGIKWWV